MKYISDFSYYDKGGQLVILTCGVVTDKTLYIVLAFFAEVGRYTEYLYIKVIGIGEDTAVAKLVLYVFAYLFRLSGIEYRKRMICFKSGVTVEAVDTCDILTDYFVENTVLMEELTNCTTERSPEHKRQSLHIYGKLQLVGFIHTDTCGRLHCEL